MKKLVFIKWEDTFGCPAGWEFEEDLNTKTTVIHTVGFVVKETKKKITVSPHIGGLNRKQKAITESDFKVLTDIVNNPDKVINQGKKWENLQTIKYIKRYGNEEWHYLEAVNENKKRIFFIDFWIKNKK